MIVSQQKIILLTAMFCLAMDDWGNARAVFEECPSNCTCHGVNNSLAIDCHHGLFENLTRLSNEIDKLLSNTKTMANLSFLTIINTPLTDVPKSVCNLTQLTKLHLNHNDVSRLPDNCFSRMTNITYLSAVGNNITELQDGLFDGLSKLQGVYLQKNKIAVIGPRFFLNMNNHVINTVNLSRNNLQTIDAWIFSLAFNQSENMTHISLYLDNNNISNSSNDIGWRLDRTITPARMRLYLRHNNVRHFTDMLDGWNITYDEFFFMIKVDKPRPRKSLILRLELLGNPLDCSCKDFTLFKVLKLNHTSYSQFYRNMVCASPKDLEHKEVEAIDLSQFVCNVTEHCPARCHCVYQPSNSTMHVYCANTNMSEIPKELPVLPDSSVRYRLDFSHNPRLRYFVAKSYMINVSILYANWCAIKKITGSSWKALLNTPWVFLNDNQLHSMPSSLTSFNVTSARIFLGYNPWKCSCDRSWMRDWLLDKSYVFIDMLKMFCHTPKRLHGKSITQIPEEDFCSDPIERLKNRIVIIVVLSIGGAVVLAVITGLVTHRLRYRMFARWGFHPFDRDECVGEEMDFDIFLSCSSEDRDEADSLVIRLESMGYKVCFHERDFEGGQTIENNMTRAVMRSKRTVCLITSHFIRR
jgi:hypothetical protein